MTLPLLITFPDGHPRPIVAAELLVDGVLAVSQVQPPFDSLTWSMPPDTRPGEVTLQAAVTDSLGLRGLSEPQTLRLETRRAPGLLETRPWLIGLLVASVIATAAAIGLMTRFGTRPPPAAQASSTAAIRRASLAPASPDQAEAQLQSLEADLDPILLTGTDVTLGRDASLVTYVLLDPSASAVHARLIRQVSGRYLLRDQELRRRDLGEPPAGGASRAYPGTRRPCALRPTRLSFPGDRRTGAATDPGRVSGRL